MDKKAQLNWKIIVLSAIIILAIIYLALFLGYGRTCIISEQSILKAEQGGFSGTIQGMINWIKEKAFFCGRATPNFIDKSIYWVKDLLGFNKTFFDFIPDLVTGALAGLWIFLIFLAAKTERLMLLIPGVRNILKASYKRYDKSLMSSWLGFIGSSPWKIIPIAVAYAVLMQIPIVNSSIDFITFNALFFCEGLLECSWSWILKSIILAFYIGLLPSSIESYTRYRLRKRYYSAIEREKAVLAINKIRLNK